MKNITITILVMMIIGFIYNNTIGSNESRIERITKDMAGAGAICQWDGACAYNRMSEESVNLIKAIKFNHATNNDRIVWEAVKSNIESR